MSGKPIFLGKANSGVDIFFDVENGFWERDIVVTGLQEGASLGEPLVVPQEYFYSLFGQKVKDLFGQIHFLRSMSFSLGGKKQKEPTPIPWRSCRVVDESIVFHLPSGVTLVLRVDEKVEEAARTILDLEAKASRFESQRAIETAAYIQAQHDGNPRGISLL